MVKLLLYDLKTDKNNKLIELVNNELQQYKPEYVQKYGLFGSEKWWQNFDKNEIETTEIIGRIVHIGMIKDDDFDEISDLIIIKPLKEPVEYYFEGHLWERTQGLIKYDREDFWLNPEIQLGDKIKIIKAIVVFGDRLSSIIRHLEIRIELIK